jgi:hypothetical protein
MKMNIDLDLDQISKIVLEALKEDYRMNCKSDKIDNSDDMIPPDEELLSALNMVISYYSSREQYEEWAKERAFL